MYTSSLGLAIINLWLKGAVRCEPKVDLQGNRVLFHGPPIFIFSSLCFVMGIFVLMLGFTVAPIGTPNNEAIYFVIIVVPFLLLGVAFLLEGLKGRVTVTDDGILAEAPWPSYPKTMLWRDVASVAYSVGWSSFIIIGKNGSRLRICGYFYGIRYLVDSFERRLSSGRYHEAKGFIDQVRDLG